VRPLKCSLLFAYSYAHRRICPSVYTWFSQASTSEKDVARRVLARGPTQNIPAASVRDMASHDCLAGTAIVRAVLGARRSSSASEMHPRRPEAGEPPSLACACPHGRANLVPVFHNYGDAFFLSSPLALCHNDLGYTSPHL
jgi:hypothetical protein